VKLLLCASLLAIASVAVNAQGQTPPEPLQVGTPTYRAGTYVVPIGLTLNYRKQPWTGLTASDVTVVLDKTSITPLELQFEKETPNRYTIYFQPPDTARDGKSHVLQIKVKKPGAKDWTTLPLKHPLTLPKLAPRN
jgi:hypothetical protein